jgi:hypothetical protein
MFQCPPVLAASALLPGKMAALPSFLGEEERSMEAPLAATIERTRQNRNEDICIELFAP